MTHATTVVFDITEQFGADKYISQVASSNDNRVHSFTLKLSDSGVPAGCATNATSTPLSSRSDIFAWNQPGTASAR